MRRLLEPMTRCRSLETTRTTALLGQRRAVYATDGSIPGELASAAFAVAAKLLRDGGFPLRDERLVEYRRFAHLERIVLWLPDQEVGP
ncbi:MAG: hypothetical protein H0W81_06665 [Chloroflexi bacterium]|nr:hypothetical protein [Chloroflexota bacterium]